MQVLHHVLYAGERAWPPYRRPPLPLTCILLSTSPQGVLQAYRSLESPYLIRRYGLTLTDLAVSQNVYTAAWMIKPIYGYLSDNFAPMGKALGFRRPYVFWGTLLGGLSFALLPSIAPTGAMWSAYLFIVFTRSFGVAIADAAVDGLLIDADVGSYGSFAQGVMNSGRSVGELIFGRSAAELAGNDVSANAWYLLAAGIWLATPFAFAVKVR